MARPYERQVQVTPAAVADFSGTRMLGSAISNMSEAGEKLALNQARKYGDRKEVEGTLKGQQDVLDAGANYRNVKFDPLDDSRYGAGYARGAMAAAEAQIRLEIDKRAGELEVAHANDPEGFAASYGAFKDELLGTMPEHLKLHAQTLYGAIGTDTQQRLFKAHASNQRRLHAQTLDQESKHFETQNRRFILGGQVGSDGHKAAIDGFRNNILAQVEAGLISEREGELALKGFEGRSNVATAVTTIYQDYHREGGTAEAAAGAQQKFLAITQDPDLAGYVSDQDIAGITGEYAQLVRQDRYERAQAEAEAKRAAHERRIEAQASLAMEMDNDLARVSTGQGAPMVSERQFQEAYGDRWERHWHSYQKRMSSALAMGQVGGMNLHELRQVQSEPLPDPASPTYKTDLIEHQTRLELARKREEAIEADPAGAAMQHNRNLAAMFNASLEAGNPERIREVIDETLAYQTEELGIDPSMATAVPRAFIDNFSASIRTADDTRQAAGTLGLLYQSIPTTHRAKFFEELETKGKIPGASKAAELAASGNLQGASEWVSASRIDKLPTIDQATTKKLTAKLQGTLGARAAHNLAIANLTGDHRGTSRVLTDMEVAQKVARVRMAGGKTAEAAASETGSELAGTGNYITLEGLGTAQVAPGTDASLYTAGMREARRQILEDPAVREEVRSAMGLTGLPQEQAADYLLDTLRDGGGALMVGAGDGKVMLRLPGGGSVGRAFTDDEILELGRAQQSLNSDDWFVR